MAIIHDLLETFGIRQTPWVMRVYMVLLLICVGLIVISLFRIPDTGGEDHPAWTLYAFSMDAFKLVLGAVIGSLSMAAQVEWGRKPGGGESG